MWMLLNFACLDVGAVTMLDTAGCFHLSGVQGSALHLFIAVFLAACPC